MFYDIIIDVQGMAAINAITAAFPSFNTRRTTPSFSAKKLPISQWRYVAMGTIHAADLAIIGDILMDIGNGFDTIRMGKVN